MRNISRSPNSSSKKEAIPQGVTSDITTMYLLTAVANLIRTYQPDSDVGTTFLPAVNRLWSNMIEKKTYVTGGIGAIKQWEGFGVDYFLPQSTDEGGCYAETCAAIAAMMLAERLLQVDLDSHYADIMELCLYNAVLARMSLDGKAFTYVNQLASSVKNLSERHEWFECACCPPNVTRTLGYLGGYVWSHSSHNAEQKAIINVHLYTSATLQFGVAESVVKITQKTDWPRNGDVDFTIATEEPPVDIDLRLRIPDGPNRGT